MTHVTIPQPEARMVRFETAGEILARKGRHVWTIGPDQSVFEAIRYMEEKSIGALLVMEHGAIAGLLSERDYARKIALKGRQSKDTRVREIMTSPVVTIGPDSQVQECLRLVTDRRVRHLPVVENGKLIGIVSIGDLVNSTIHSLAETVNHLGAYISGEYPH
jgi:CBS domain-containing protein